MSRAVADDGVGIDFEITGSGTPLLFIHEFAGDSRSWEQQVRSFARTYKCITYNARGYPPSDVPPAVESYSQDRAVTDAITVLDALGIDQAHVVGASMGGFCALHLGLRFPARALSLVLVGVGYGAQPEGEDQFRAECEATARAFAEAKGNSVAHRYAGGPARVQFQNKDPRGWNEFRQQLAEHSRLGLALTMRGVQQRRPSLYRMNDALTKMTTPILIVCGDEDEGCLETSLMLKRTIPSAGLAFLPKTGHTCNLEETELFNYLVQQFLVAVDHGRWPVRDPRSHSSSQTGMADPSQP